MAAIAAAAVVHSSFPTLHCQVHSTTTWPCYYSNHFLKISPTATRTPNITLISSSSAKFFGTEVTVKKGRAVPRLAATVTEKEEFEEVVEEKGESNCTGKAVTPILYVGNLPFSFDGPQLAAIIVDYSIPVCIQMHYDRKTGVSRGFALVRMSSLADCETVIANLHGRVFGGRVLRVNISEKPKPKDPLYPETEHKLYIGNLSWSITFESFVRPFQEYGTVVRARILYDEGTGKSRGYGFVSYETREQMENALQNLDGVELDGRAMRISLAQGKKQ